MTDIYFLKFGNRDKDAGVKDTYSGLIYIYFFFFGSMGVLWIPPPWASQFSRPHCCWHPREPVIEALVSSAYLTLLPLLPTYQHQLLVCTSMLQHSFHLIPEIPFSSSSRCLLSSFSVSLLCSFSVSHAHLTLAWFFSHYRRCFLFGGKGSS